jgi:twinkle protein
MAEIIDAVSFEGFEDVVEVSRLRRASSYDLRTEFRPLDGTRAPSMISTKLRGGLEFRRGEVTCWTGYNGHRKSIFSGQIGLDLITQRKRVLIASFEMLPGATLARMARQAWGMAAPSDDELEKFGRWTDGKLWLFDHTGRITPSKCLAMCRYFAMEKLGHHVFIDSMMMVCASEESFDEQKGFITDLVRMAQETGLHVHLITHCRKPASGGGEDKPPTKYDLRGSAAISDQAHNVVTIWANRAKKERLESGRLDAMNEPDALVTVEKQRNGQWEGRVKLWFDESSLKFRDESGTPVLPYAPLAENA